MKAGDIVLIRFPQSDLKTGKLRLALVVAIAPGRHEDLLLALITSRVYQAVPDFDEIIEIDDSDFDSSGLKLRSVVRLARLATVDASVIEARLGEVGSQRMVSVRRRLGAWLHA